MSVTASCGHVLTDKEEFGKFISIRDYSKDGSRAVTHLTVCDKCYEDYKKRKAILIAEKEQLQWLNIKTK